MRQRLHHALSLCAGVEAMVVLRDVCGLERAEAERVAEWAAGALVRAALAGAGDA